MKNPFSHIVPTLLTDYSLPSGLPSGLPVLLSMGFLPVGKGIERREEKRREEKRSDPWLPDEKLKQGEARHDAIYYSCYIMQNNFMNSIF